jgi:dTDP-4-amino-4,6-dideoxygalactose transaminase
MLSLPMFPHLTEAQQRQVVNKIKEFYSSVNLQPAT